MSKLYNAISRLDEIALLGETDPRIPDIPFQQSLDKNGSFFVRMLVLSAALILFGLVAVGMTARWQGWFDLQSKTTIETTYTPVLPSVTPVPSLSGTLEKRAENVNPTAKVVLPTLPPGEILHQSREVHTPDSMTDNPPATVINRLPAKTIKKIHRMDKQQVLHGDITTEPRPLQIAEHAESPLTEQFIDQTAQLSRWLHQAEQRRRGGDWEGAISLFTKVWQISENPAVANNLAASLIQMDRFSEAYEILTKALQKAPNDQDLKENLRVAQQLADK